MTRQRTLRLVIAVALATAVLAAGTVPASAVKSDGSGEVKALSDGATLVASQGSGTGSPAALTDSTLVASKQEGSGSPAALADPTLVAGQEGGSGLPSLTAGTVVPA
jgi:hypothetical protein